MTTREPIPNEYRTTLICIDSYVDCCLQGRLYHPSSPQPLVFANLMQFLLTTGQLFDELQFPQAETALRSFVPGEVSIPIAHPGLDAQGELATFSLKVVFRQHASWQGLVTWLEKRQEQPFRSVLELTMLLHSALQA